MKEVWELDVHKPASIQLCLAKGQYLALAQASRSSGMGFLKPETRNRLWIKDLYAC